MPFGFNAGKVDAVAGNTDLADLFLAKILKALRVFFGVHSDCYLHIKTATRRHCQEIGNFPEFQTQIKVDIFCQPFRNGERNYL